jgi:hypothetical protein
MLGSSDTTPTAPDGTAAKWDKLRCSVMEGPIIVGLCCNGSSCPFRGHPVMEGPIIVGLCCNVHTHKLGCSAMEGTHLLLAVTRIQPDAEKIASDALTHLL